MAHPIADRLLVLIGARGSGKTTVAKALAAKLNGAAIDLDDEIERAAGKSIAAIFAAEGEAAFRELETRTLQAILAAHKQDNVCVLAVGGGAVLAPQNQQLMREQADVVWLRAETAHLLERIDGDEESAKRRPPLTELSLTEEVKFVLEARTPIYQALANFVVDTDDQSPQAIADAIIHWHARAISGTSEEN